MLLWYMYKLVSPRDVYVKVKREKKKICFLPTQFPFLLPEKPCKTNQPSQKLHMIQDHKMITEQDVCTIAYRIQTPVRFLFSLQPSKPSR